MQNGIGQQFTPRGTGNMWPEIARVIATDNAQMSVDLALEDGGILRNVPVLSDVAGTKEGKAYLPKVDNANATVGGSGIYASIKRSRTNDTFAAVGYFGGNPRKPFVFGFLWPEQFVGSFKDTAEVERHRNGGYTLWDDTAVELNMPNGISLRIGPGTAKHVVNGANFDTRTPFTDTDGTANTPASIFVKHHSGTSIEITPSGSIVITKAGGGSFALESHTHNVPTIGSSGAPQ